MHSGDNHWLVMKRRWSLKMLKAIVHCSDHCTSSSNHVVECVRRVIAHGGRQAKHSQPWRFARRRFIVATSSQMRANSSKSEAAQGPRAL